MLLKKGRYRGFHVHANERRFRCFSNCLSHWYGAWKHYVNCSSSSNQSKKRNILISPACLNPRPGICIIEKLRCWEVQAIGIPRAIIQLKRVIAGDAEGHFVLVIRMNIILLPIRGPSEPALSVGWSWTKLPPDHGRILALERIVVRRSWCVEDWPFFVVQIRTNLWGDLQGALIVDNILQRGEIKNIYDGHCHRPNALKVHLGLDAGQFWRLSLSRMIFQKNAKCAWYRTGGPFMLHSSVVPADFSAATNQPLLRGSGSAFWRNICTTYIL